MRWAPGRNAPCQVAGATLGDREPVDHGQAGFHSELADAESDSRVERAANVDVRRMLRRARRSRDGRWLVGGVVLVAVGLVLLLLFRIGVFDGPPPAAQSPGTEQPQGAAALAIDMNHPFT